MKVVLEEGMDVADSSLLCSLTEEDGWWDMRLQQHEHGAGDLTFDQHGD